MNPENKLPEQQATVKRTPDGVAAFIRYNRKINWEAEYEGGAYCLSERKVEQFINEHLVGPLEEITAERDRLRSLNEARANYIGLLEDAINGGHVNLGKEGTDKANAYLTKIAALAGSENKD